jgi:hypothetical protein
MGEVFRARDARLGREVAVKILPANLLTDADRLRRFEQEAQAAAALNHPNILAVTEILLWRAGDSKAMPFLSMPSANVTAARFSPDERWVAYVSDESGRNEIYVVPFTVPQGNTAQGPARGKWQISTGGGTLPRWRRDGKEIFYFDEAGSRMMAATVNGLGNVFEVGSAQSLFPIRPSGGITVNSALQRIFYDVSHDGQRFLVNAEPPETSSGTPPVTVVMNWLAPSKRQP